MLEDIVFNTQRVFDQFIPQNKPINSKKALYDIYRNLQELIRWTDCLSEHYLALDFNEEYLQNSSWGTPSDKWRYFFNKDLETLNKAIKKYYLKLNTLAPDGDWGCFGSYLSEFYNPKTYYGFIRDEYSVGHVTPCSFEMICYTLRLESVAEERYVQSFNKLILDTYEKRVALQSDLREKLQLLKNEVARLKSYLQTNCTLDELL